MVLRTGFRGSSALVFYVYLCLDMLCCCLAFLPHSGMQLLPGWYAVRQKRFDVFIPALYTTTDNLPRNGSGVARPEERQTPEEHKVLYESINGDTEEHGATAAKEKERKKAPEFNGVEMYDMAEWVRVFGGRSSKVAAVYEVIGRDRTPSYIGMSRHVGIALQCHQRNERPELVSRVRLKSFRDPKCEEMEALRAEWIAAALPTPIGNREGNEWLHFIRDAEKTFKQEFTQDGGYKERNKPETCKAMAGKIFCVVPTYHHCSYYCILQSYLSFFGTYLRLRLTCHWAPFNSDNTSLVDKLGPIDSPGLDEGDKRREKIVDMTPDKVEVVDFVLYVFTIKLLRLQTTLINLCRVLLLLNQHCFHLKILQLKLWIRLLIR